MPQLSILVPVYKTEKYLSKCVDSILSQTFTDFELILIDDGSPDNCPQICDEYAVRDARVIVIHQKNAGVSAARNAGLDIARGEYIGFVDSDDWIEPEMYEAMMAFALKNESDLVFCSWYENSPDGTERINKLFSDKSCIVSSDDFYRGLFSSPRTVAGACWNKLVRKSHIEHNFCENLSICEDNLFVAEFVNAQTRIGYVAEHFYHIFSRPESATRADLEKMIPSLQVREEIIHICGAASRVGRDYAEMDYLNMASYYMRNLMDGQYIQRAMKDYIRKNWISIMRNKAIYWKTKILYLSMLLHV